MTIKNKILLLSALAAVTFSGCFLAAEEIIMHEQVPPKVAQVDSMLEGMLQLHVNIGDKVKKGELLFNIDSKSYKILQQKSVFAYLFKRHEFHRMEELIGSHSVSLEQYQEAEYNYLSALEDLRTADLQIEECLYYAPFDGVVTNIINYTGSAVGDGNEVVDVTAV